jgi:hypothetical protein
MGEIGGLHVLEHGEPRKYAGVLERATHPHATNAVRRRPSDVTAREPHAPGIGAQMPGDDVEQGRFPGAIGSNDGCDLQALGGEADAGDRRTSVEGHLDVVKLKHGCDLAA